MVLPSDHFIADEAGFRRVRRAALEGARRGLLRRSASCRRAPRPATATSRSATPIAPGLLAVARFVEKPDRARAEAFVAGGKHLWNAGMFFFRAQRHDERHRARTCPRSPRALDRLDEAAAEGTRERALEAAFPTLPSISIDHGVMEKAEAARGRPGRLRLERRRELGERLGARAEGRATATRCPDGSVAVDARGNLVRDLHDGAKASASSRSSA